MNDDFLDEIVGAGSADGARRGTRRDGRKERDRRRRSRRRRTVAALVISLLVLGGVGIGVWQWVLPALGNLGPTQAAPEDYPGPGHGSVEVTIPKGATGAQMGRLLAEQGVVRTATAFSKAFTANPGASGIQPGTYRMLLEMPAADAVTALLDPSNRVQTKVTIPEGFRVDQVVDRLSSITTISTDDIKAAMQDTSATGLPAEADGTYEGWLFPATYTFQPDETATDMIAAMVAKTVSVLDSHDVAPADRERILTMASLVEREAKTSEDRAKVARAIQNRLDIDMKLDIDASVAYGLGISGTQLTKADLAKDTPYNTYLHTGLPPTPIASPGEDSINAVLNPADGPWLFWVTVNPETGETLFAETYPEQQKNIAKLRQWQADHPSSSG
ncbi:endolytic transglycosylase MltG [Isoptericola sp. b441]|uniref:Endolytic murein transglycosylase n=1 Tax=Actinotalea lenta TaxID=3064654 RepID=A0ABT9DE66_9CELL|nr:endolytic transglycosylase MltG [Isoptericola sp. b441]MDO8107801.1 endolytic transglycosylase MltG [Isoptericola sp. b441]